MKIPLPKHAPVPAAVRDLKTGRFLPGHSGTEGMKPGTIKARQEALEKSLDNIAQRFPYLPSTPQAMLLEIGMTGRYPGYREIRAEILKAHPIESIEYKKIIRAHPWLEHGWLSWKVRMAALKAILPYILPKLKPVAFIDEDERPPEPTIDWVRIAAENPMLRKVIEREILGRPPLAPPAVTPIVGKDLREVAPALAPDGVRFAYVKNQNGASEIWLGNRTDGSEKLIVGQKDFPAEARVEFRDCVISSDGSRVEYRFQGSGSFDINLPETR